jgi:hypothetical protein
MKSANGRSADPDSICDEVPDVVAITGNVVPHNNARPPRRHSKYASAQTYPINNSQISTCTDCVSTVPQSGTRLIHRQADVQFLLGLAVTANAITRGPTLEPPGGLWGSLLDLSQRERHSALSDRSRALHPCDPLAQSRRGAGDVAMLLAAVLCVGVAVTTCTTSSISSGG